MKSEFLNNYLSRQNNSDVEPENMKNVFSKSIKQKKLIKKPKNAVKRSALSLLNNYISAPSFCGFRNSV